MAVHGHTTRRELRAAPLKDNPPPPAEQTIAEVLLAQLNKLQPDDWHGITDPRIRKKLQNRANQRALRSRRRALDKAAASASTSTSLVLKPDPGKLNPSDLNQSMIALCRSELSNICTVGTLHSNLASIRRTMQRLEAMALYNYNHHNLSSPRTDLLLHIIQFNFSRALTENIHVLGFTSEDMDDEALSPITFSTSHPRTVEFTTKPLPRDLTPTPVQRTIPHHPWLDLLPVAQMRDNLIRAEDTYDDVALCRDMKGYHQNKVADGEAVGIIVWRDPWDAMGWEVSESFARKWSWVVQGCEDLFRSTNSWRAKRGERPLFRVAG